MLGFAIAVLLVLALVGTMLFVWLAAWIDAWLGARREVAYRNEWLRDWRNYSRQSPLVSIRKYAEEHQKDRPTAMPYKKRRSYEVPLFGLATCCFAGEVALLAYGFVIWDRSDHRAAFATLCCYTVFVAVSLLVWYWLILEEKILPSYARTDSAYHPTPLPPLPDY